MATRRSNPSRTPKRRGKSETAVRVLVTGFTGDEVRNRAEKVCPSSIDRSLSVAEPSPANANTLPVSLRQRIERLGGLVIAKETDWGEATHVVVASGRFVNVCRPKLVAGVLAKAPIVDVVWLEQSAKVKRFIDCTPYLATCPELRALQQRRKNIPENFRADQITVYVDSSVENYRAIIAMLRLAGVKVIDKGGLGNVTNPENVCYIAGRRATVAIAEAQKKGIHEVEQKSFIEAVLTGDLDLLNKSIVTATKNHVSLRLVYYSHCLIMCLHTNRAS